MEENYKNKEIVAVKEPEPSAKEKEHLVDEMEQKSNVLDIGNSDLESMKMEGQNGMNERQEEVEIVSDHPARSKKHRLVIALSVVPGIIDGLGHGTLSLAQLLTMTLSLKILEDKEDITLLEQMPLLMVAAFAAVGASALAVHENKEKVDEVFEHFIKNPNHKVLSAMRQGIAQLFHRYPTEIMVVGISGTVDAVIFYSNLRAANDLLGYIKRPSALVYPGVIFSFFIGSQNIVLNGTPLLKFVPAEENR